MGAAMIEECTLCQHRLHVIADANVASRTKVNHRRRVREAHGTEAHRQAVCMRCGCEFTQTGPERHGKYAHRCFPCLLGVFHVKHNGDAVQMLRKEPAGWPRRPAGG